MVIFFTLLATAVGIVSVLGLVIVGLMEAPWQVLLLGLLGALYALQRQIWVSESVAEISDVDISPAIAPDPTLASTPAKPEPTELAQSTSSEGTEAADDSYELTYRGIRYRSSQFTPEASSAEQSADRPDAKIEGIYRGQPWQR
ncbi:MAG: hypothetical protein WBG32_07375 [Nodosilinea sp.]